MNTISGNGAFSTLPLQNQLSTTNDQLKKVFDRLSSALRINQASDDAAGLAISEQMLSQLNGLNMAERNTNDGLSVTGLADAYLGGVNGDLQRMRELAVQSANGTYGAAERSAMNQEFAQLQQGIGSTLSSANFNGQPLFSQTGSIGIQAGANGGQTINIPTRDLLANDANGVGGVLDNDSLNIGTSAGAQSALSALGDAIGRVGTARSEIGASANQLEGAISNIQGMATAQAESRGRIVDADYARETSRLGALSIRQQAGSALLGQAGKMNSAFVLSLLGGR